MIERSIQHLLLTKDSEGTLRHIPDETPGLIDFTSNDYLGLAREYAECGTPGAAMTSSASRLLAPVQKEYAALENELSDLYGRPALLFNSGYHANTGIIPALSIGNTLFVADKLCHASMIDGLILTRGNFLRFPHNDFSALERIIAKNIDSYDRIVILTESVFSMDGDIAPLKEIAELRDKYEGRIVTYVDEAHGVGVFGNYGLGVSEELNLISRTDVIVGTFGKALASYGAFAITSSTLREWLLNSARSFIFSTAVPPAVAAHSLSMLKIACRSREKREHLHNIAAQLRDGVSRLGSTPTISKSQIVPWLTGDALKAVMFAEELKQRGIAALPIRRPTVPPGTERIRFSLSASHTSDEVELLLNHLKSLTGE